MSQTSSTAAADMAVGRVIRAQSGFYTLLGDEGLITAVLRGRLKKDRQAMDVVALGDFVRYRPADPRSGTAATIVEVLPRQSTLARRAPGPRGAWSKDVIVANIDQLVAVMAVREPEPRFGMLDRMLALAEMDHLRSLIVMNKIDLGLSASVEVQLAPYERMGYAVLRTSARTGEGIPELAAELAGRVSAIVGPSGVGKSSLLNAIEPGLALRVGEVSSATGKGRHTTRVGELHRLANGGLVADTPGLREFGLWDVDLGELEWAFADFRPYLGQCRFDNCCHRLEPDCAIREAVARGDIAEARYLSYLRLLDDEGEASGPV